MVPLLLACVAYPAIPPSRGALSEAWVFGLKQDGLTRSNLAVGVADPPLGGPSGQINPLVLSLDFFDGESGVLVGSSTVSLNSTVPDWAQLNAPLSSFGVRSGYARVRGSGGPYGAFFAYGVVNDGALPGQGTGDGSYLAMTPTK